MALVMTVTAFGYAGQTLATITVGAPSGTLKCNTAITVTATLISTDGDPFTGETVKWKFSSTPSNSDKINKTPTTTNSKGVAKTTVTLACVAGNRRVTATSDGISAGAVLSVTSAGLPRTSTLPGGNPAGDLPIGMILALFAVLIGGGIIIRRVATSPR
jgi:hypothetical protein